jgi:hypothetical protein
VGAAVGSNVGTTVDTLPGGGVGEGVGEGVSSLANLKVAMVTLLLVTVGAASARGMAARADTNTPFADAALWM